MIPGTNIIIGLVPLLSANGVIDNLIEADVKERDISLVMDDASRARNILDDYGPFKGTDVHDLEPKLASLNVKNVDDYVKGVNRGDAFIAISVEGDEEAAVREIVADNGGQAIYTIKT